MERVQLISMIHFLEKRDEEDKKGMGAEGVVEISERKYWDELEQTQRLLKTIGGLTQQC